jgi:hypothetical protein
MPPAWAISRCVVARLARSSAHHVERQARQVARLVHQHLRFVLELLDLVVDLLQRARGRQDVLHRLVGSMTTHCACAVGITEHGTRRRRQEGFFHGCFS